MYNIIWYNGNNFQNVFTPADCISKGNKKIVTKSKPYINIGAGFDCETSQYGVHDASCQTLEEYRNALKSYVYIWQFSVGSNIYLCRDYDLLDNFLCDLDSACDEAHQNATLIVWDANIKFEFSFFKRIFAKAITKVFAKSKTEIITFNYGKHIQFRECLGAFGQSLEALAKNYTTTQKLKGDLEYDKIRTPITPLTDSELQYCINDVAILSELTAYAHNTYTLKGDTIPLTQTGIVRNAIKKNLIGNNPRNAYRYYEQNKPLIGTQEQYYKFRKYVYSGGLTHSNFYYVGHVLHNITCKDLTSAYPWALNTQYFPAGELIQCHDKSEYKNAFSHRHWFFRVTLYNVKSKSTHSTLSMHKVIHMTNAVIDNGRIYKADTINAYFTEIDWKNFCLIYDFEVKKSVIQEVYYFTKSARIPQKVLSVMNDWYKKKTLLKPLVSKQHKHDPEYPERKKEYDRLKQLINSVYGMTVTALYLTDLKWNTETKEIDETENDWDTTSNTLFNPWWGYYCTAYVRNRLIECISKYPDSIVQYDTDSIYCLPDSELMAYIEEINDRVYKQAVKSIPVAECWDLGQWDDDGNYVDFIALGSKRYIGKYSDGSYKITFAGANEKDLLSEASKRHEDIMEYCKHININEKISTKLGAYHFEGAYTAPVTDYLGNTTYVTTYGGTTIKTVQFRAGLSHMFEVLQKEYERKTS